MTRRLFPYGMSVCLWSSDLADFVDAHIGSRLRKARLKKGLSQTELGEALGTAFQQIQKYEKGINRISASRLFHAAHLLDVDVEYFFTDLKPGNLLKSIPADADKVASIRPSPDDIRHRQTRVALHNLIAAIQQTEHGAMQAVSPAKQSGRSASAAGD
ncbi:helix-turn-helix domain-containing protein [Consotaella salsifontis]|uniref:helix-turn-helix domain-containing protein n=1 Tax=Consotaella salsifontis TaxID=1365950 RepID=UPI00099A3DB0|nr:helix-turn-helix transcriptional regulator [Consotaella salsifontis]